MKYHGVNDYDIYAADPDMLAWLREVDRKNFEISVSVFMTVMRKREWRALCKDEGGAREAFSKELARSLFNSFEIRRETPRVSASPAQLAEHAD